MFKEKSHLLCDPLRLLLWFLITLGIALHACAALRGNWNLDELQYLKNGWATTQGLIPYRDFWDNHGILSNYIYGLPFHFFPPVHESFLGFRALAFLITLVFVGLTAVAASLAFPEQRHVSLASAAFLLSSELFIMKAREIRGDNLMNLCWVASVVLLFAGLRRSSVRVFWLAGIALGASALFSVKFAIVAVAAGIILLSAWRRNVGAHLRELVMFGLGTILPIIAAAGWIALQGISEDFLAQAFHSSMDRDFTLAIGPLSGAVKSYPIWMGLAGVALARSVHREWTHKALPGERWLWPPLAFLLFQYFFLLPSKHSQSLLPVHPLIAVLGAHVFLLFYGWVGRLGKPVLKCLVILFMLAGALLQAYHMLHNNHYVNGILSWQLGQAQRLQAHTQAQDYVLSGVGVPIFRRSPISTNSFVNYLQEAYRQGKIDFQVTESLVQKRVRFVVADSRIRSLPAADLSFIERHYLKIAGTPTKSPLLVAGGVEPITTSTVTLPMRIPGWYWVAMIQPEDLDSQGQLRKPESQRFYSDGHGVALSVPDGKTTAVYAQIPVRYVSVTTRQQLTSP